MVSASAGSSMPDSELRISGGIFLLSLTYWSNWLMIARRIASTSLFGVFGGRRRLGLGDETAQDRRPF